jgi:hypothetical protein
MLTRMLNCGVDTRLALSPCEHQRIFCLNQLLFTENCIIPTTFSILMLG